VFTLAVTLVADSMDASGLSPPEILDRHALAEAL